MRLSARPRVKVVDRTKVLSDRSSNAEANASRGFERKLDAFECGRVKEVSLSFTIDAPLSPDSLAKIRAALHGARFVEDRPTAGGAIRDWVK